ncbi:hypothetical protein BGZ60DRAFT_284175 [Tricladium varicosporioides]|nr:hypothetical protein BGZ60DRAFT_284175 [Hymenoscyphus varicosporioides]
MSEIICLCRTERPDKHLSCGQPLTFAAAFIQFSEQNRGLEGATDDIPMGWLCTPTALLTRLPHVTSNAKEDCSHNKLFPSIRVGSKMPSESLPFSPDHRINKESTLPTLTPAIDPSSLSQLSCTSLNTIVSDRRINCWLDLILRYTGLGPEY